MSWPRGISRSGDRRHRPLDVLTPRLAEYLRAAEAVEAAGRMVTPTEVGCWLGVHRTAAIAARKRLSRLGLWRWSTSYDEWRSRRMARTETLASRAAAEIVGLGLPVTIPALIDRSGLSRKGLRLAIRRLEARGDWTYPIISDRVAAMARRHGAIPIVPPVGRRPHDPTPAEILMACRSILTKGAGLSIEAADMRLGAKAVRYGARD